jgi:hypothetical protein
MLVIIRTTNQRTDDGTVYKQIKERQNKKLGREVRYES